MDELLNWPWFSGKTISDYRDGVTVISVVRDQSDETHARAMVLMLCTVRANLPYVVREKIGQFVSGTIVATDDDNFYLNDWSYARIDRVLRRWYNNDITACREIRLHQHHGITITNVAHFVNQRQWRSQMYRDFHNLFCSDKSHLPYLNQGKRLLEIQRSIDITEPDAPEKHVLPRHVPPRQPRPVPRLFVRNRDVIRCIKHKLNYR